MTILKRMVTAYLELAELQTLNRQPMTMQGWIDRLQGFLTMTGRPVLDHAGAISHEAAFEKAHAEYERYRQRVANEPSVVEAHFLQAAKRIEQAKKTGE